MNTTTTQTSLDTTIAVSTTQTTTTATTPSTHITTNPTTTSPTPTTTKATITTEVPDDHAAAIACGVIFGIIGVALIIVGVIFLLRWLKRWRTKESHEEDYVNVEPRLPPANDNEEHAPYSKLVKTPSFHPYGEFNDNTGVISLSGNNGIYGNTETANGQYNNVTNSTQTTLSKIALMPQQGKNNEAYEPMDIHMQPEEADVASDRQSYEKMTPGTPKLSKTKTDELLNKYGTTLPTPKKHSHESKDGYVNTAKLEKGADPTAPQTNIDMLNSTAVQTNTTTLNSNIEEELPSVEKNDSHYVNTTTLDEIIADNIVDKDIPPVKGKVPFFSKVKHKTAK